MTGTKKRIMSVSVDPEIVEVLDEIKKITKQSRSSIVEDMVTRFIHVIDDEKLDKIVKGYMDQIENDTVPIVLYIPSHLRENPGLLKNWLDQRSAAIQNALSV